MKVLCVFLKIFFTVLCVTALNFRTGRQGTKQATFERIDNTCGERNLSLIYTLLNMRSEGTKLFMNSTVNVKRDISSEPSMLMRIDRCKNKENLDTCEHFYDFKTDKYCEILSQESALWTPLFDSYEPKLRCPHKKGMYRSSNGMLDVSALLLFPLDAWFWRVKVTIFNKETNTLLTCIFVEAHITTI